MTDDAVVPNVSETIPVTILEALGIQGLSPERSGEEREQSLFYCLNDGSRVSEDELLDHLRRVEQMIWAYLVTRGRRNGRELFSELSTRYVDVSFGGSGVEYPFEQPPERREASKRLLDSEDGGEA